MDIRNISTRHVLNTERPASHEGRTATDPFEHFMQEEMSILKVKASHAPDETSLCTRISQDQPAEVDHNRHIDAFVHQALAEAPESERKIWARMRDELGI